MRLRAPVLALLALPACTADLGIPSSALVTCSVQSPACPDGYVCDGGLGLCLPTTPATGDGPRVAGTPSITPAVAGANRRIRVELSTDHALVGRPALSIVSGAFAASLVYESGSATGPYVFAYETTGGEAEGNATIRGTFADAQGRVTRDATIGTVELDYTAPLIDGIDVDEAVIADGLAWVDSLTITLRPALPAGGEVPATASISGDIQTDVDLTYAATLPVTLQAGDGPKVLTARFADLAGNVAAVPLAVSLDTAQPTNSVVIDTPLPPTIFLNAPSLSVFFHSSGPTPSDFADYVYSVDGGVTWTATPTFGALALGVLAQDAVTTLWVRERDLFGNMTSAASQGVLVIDEDSQPPSPPHAFTETVIGLLTSEVGILLDAARDPGGGQVTYQVSGGPFQDYTDVGTEPRIVLPGADSGGTTVYVIRAVDRARNPSAGVTITVADAPFKQVATTCTSNCFATQFFSSSGLATFAAIDNSTSVLACGTPMAGDSACRHHVVYLCKRNAVDDFECSSEIVQTSRTTNQVVLAPNMGGSVLVYTDQTNQLAQVIKAKYVGADLGLNTVDDGPMYTVGSGNCQAGIAQGVYFGNSANANRLSFYNYGNDRRPNTADANEGLSVVSASSLVNGFNPCIFQTSSRQVMWRDGRSGNPRWAVFSVGADGKPGGGDDGGEWIVPHSDRPVNSADVALLTNNRVLVQQANGDWKQYDAGADKVFGNGDDAVTDVHFDFVPAALDGDKAYAFTPTPAMIDLTTDTVVALHNEAFGGGEIQTLAASPNMIFAGLHFGGVGSQLNMPAVYTSHGEPLTFQVADISGEGTPSGTLAGDLYLFIDPSNGRPTLLDAHAGGTLRLSPDAASASQVDVDAGYFTWIDSVTGDLMLFSAGADGLLETADDLGPAAVVTTGKYAWPRIDGRILVWADLSADANGLWVDTALSSSLQALDLGADGWIGGGDDLTYALAGAGTKVVTPDISGNNVVYFDYAGDGSGLCEGSRGGPATNNCTPAVARIAVTAGATPSTIAAGGVARADLRIDGDRVVWSEYATDNWNVRLHTLGGATINAVAGPYDERLPVIVGSMIAYFVDASSESPLIPGSDGVFVRDAGPDTTFNTGDDIILRQPANIRPRGCTSCGSWDFRPTWFDGDVTATGGGLMPVTTALDSGIGGQSLPIPDNGVLTDAVRITAAAWQHVEDLRLQVTLSHATPSQLEVRLVSPSGERMVLSSAVSNGTTTFTVENAPAMFDVHGDPLNGTWTLEVADRVATGTGTVTSWRLDHRR